MTWTNLPLHQIKLAFAITLALVSFTSCPTQVRAQTAQSASKTLGDVPVRFIPPQLSQQEPSGSGRGTPGNREGGGSRPSGSNCPIVDKRLTALVPATKDILGNERRPTVPPSESVLGLTADGRPTFWFYVPYISPLFAEFVLLDEKSEPLYKTTFQLPRNRSYISINLPSKPTVEPLAIGQKYRWIFSILCEPTSPSANVVVKGWVQRVAVSSALSSQLEVATPRDRGVLYAANGIWYDALTVLGNLNFTKPVNKALTNDWANLLGSVGLDEIAKEPIVGRYTPEK